MERLPFWHFFQALERELSYERWYDKYQLFLDALSGGVIVKDNNWQHFRQFCKFLYLQDLRDEVQFDFLLDEAIVSERDALEAFFAGKIATEAAEIAATALPEGSPEPPPAAPLPPPSPPAPSEESNVLPPAGNMPEPLDGRGQRSMYFHPPARHRRADVQKAMQSRMYLHTDEYFPITRRQMVKGWQFLRNREKGRPGRDVDIPSTIQQIEREGFFLEPKYLFDQRNREDALIIFADYRGSMTPFHALTDRLIYTAMHEGGHSRAQVFYFQNHPAGYVYRKPNLSEPVKLKEALLKTNRNSTLAIVISDAGAARGNNDAARIQARLETTRLFIRQLRESCAHVLWLNPMPSHRWLDTAAEWIMDEVLLMVPVLDHEATNFQDTLRTIFKQSQLSI